MTNEPTHNDRPLCVDLDGTLVSTDTMLESLLLLLRRRPWMIVPMLFWLTGGLVAFKRKLASAILLDPTQLPWRQDVIDFVREQHDAGRTTVLATASNIAIARLAGEHLGIFDHLIGTDVDQNLRGHAKVDAIRQQLSVEAYDYIGDSSMDIPVWRHATEALLVSPTASVEQVASKAGNITRIFREEGDIRNPKRAAWLSIRPMGATVIAVLLIVGKFTGLWMVPGVACALITLGVVCVWSGLSITRDLYCIQEDRNHPVRCERPIAAGRWGLARAIKWATLLNVMGTLAIVVTLCVLCTGTS